MKFRTLLASFFLFIALVGLSRNAVVVDSTTGEPLVGATVFGSNGSVAGVCGLSGVIPYISPEYYPLSVRCIGYEDASGILPSDSIVHMSRRQYHLPELTVEASGRPMLHLVAYIRDYSTLTSYYDTVTMFREKLVDFMVPVSAKKRGKGWTMPRVLSSKSYYRFSDCSGLDSVSDNSRHHFSWADWTGLIDDTAMPSALLETARSDTVSGRYGPMEIWTGDADNITLKVDVLADSAARRWIPGMRLFFRDDIDFEKFAVTYNFKDMLSAMVGPGNLYMVSYSIDSRGRGHDMFMFNRYDQPCFVNSYVEVYFIGREYIGMGEARKREKNRREVQAAIHIPDGMIPDVPVPTAALIARVESIDHTRQRLEFTPDKRLVAKHKSDFSIKARLKSMINSLVSVK